MAIYERSALVDELLALEARLRSIVKDEVLPGECADHLDMAADYVEAAAGRVAVRDIRASGVFADLHTP